MSHSTDDAPARSERTAPRTPLFDDGFPISVREALGESEQVIARDYRDGVERRIDGPHPFPAAAEEAIAPALDHVIRAERDLRAEAEPRAPAAPVPPPDDELLLQANQIAQHLRLQLGEIDRRESILTEQLTKLDEERRSVRTWVGRFEEDMVQRAALIRGREAELSQKIAAAEELVLELREMERGAREVREELAAEKAEIRAQVEQEFAAQRAELQQTRNALEESRRLVAEQMEQNRREHEAAILDCRRRLEEEWSRLSLKAAESLEEQQTQLQLDRAAWISQRDADQQRLQRERERHESNLRREEEELATRRRQFEADLQRQTQEHEQRIAAEMQKLSDERDRMHAQEQQERAVFENRLRFQTEHLEKAREELETARNEFRREQQEARALNERTESLLGKHRRQLERFRELLEEREKSIEREHDLLSRARRSFETEAEGHRNRLKMEWEAFSQERQSQRAELRRQRDVLAVHADNLESRRARLDHLRAELEETHRNTLEMRLAVEEAWARMSHAAGSDKARRQVEDARKAYAEHFRHLQEQILARRAELGEAARALAKQKDEFTVERTSLASWISERDDALRLREEQLRRDADYLDVRESAWRAARERWNHEKLSAEEIIRDLLRQLTHLNDIDRTTSHDREPFPLNPLLVRAEAPAA